MCFSATASFTAAAGLTTIGALTLSKTRTKAEIPFGMIPLLFGLQQCAEGVVWLSIQNNNLLVNSIASHIFVLFAYVIWPIFIPITILLLEKMAWRRKILSLIECAGVVLGAYFIYFLTEFQITGHVVNHCIVYATPHRDVFPIMTLYIAATCISLLLSSHLSIKWFGFATSIFLLITYGFYNFALVSVWCFFAAILSLMIFFFFRKKKRLETGYINV